MKSIVSGIMKYKSISLIFFLFAIHLTAQTKNEKESRISLEKFPEQSQLVINSIFDTVKRIRHYKEIDGEHESFESKFKIKKHWYSLEFDSNGALEDIEVTIKERHLENTIKEKIKTYLKNQFIKYDFIKIQEQYVSKDNSNDKHFVTEILKSRTSIASNFEIVVAVKTNENWEIRELTFNDLGEFLNERIIQQDSYEYIMY